MSGPRCGGRNSATRPARGQGCGLRAPSSRYVHLLLLGTGVLACSLCPRARRTPKGAGGSPQLRPTGSGRSCTRSRLLLSFFLFSLFWRLRRWRPGCTRAHVVIPTRGIISKMQRVADDEVFSTHPRDPVALWSRKEPRVWARGVSRAAAGTQVGHCRNGDSGHPERAPDAELRPQTPPTGRLPAPMWLTPPSPPRDSAAEARTLSISFKYSSWVHKVLSRERREAGGVPGLGRPVFRTVAAPDGLWAVCRGGTRDTVQRTSPPRERPPLRTVGEGRRDAAPCPLPLNPDKIIALRVSLAANSPCRI